MCQMLIIGQIAVNPSSKHLVSDSLRSQILLMEVTSKYCSSPAGPWHQIHKFFDVFFHVTRV